MASTSDVRGARARGWVAVVAGAFIVVVMSAVWVMVIRAIAENRGSVGPDTARFLSQTYVGFALVIVCGILGLANGVFQLRTGRRNRILSVVTLVIFGAALVTVLLATRPQS